MSEIKVQKAPSFKERFLLILLTIFLVIACLIIWQAIDVFLLAFAAVLLAIFLSTLANFVKKITHLPYPLALVIVLILIIGLIAVTFWLYAPLISEQFGLLFQKLPIAFNQLKDLFSSFFDLTFLAQLDVKKEVFSNLKVLSQLTKVFSFTFGSILGFLVFLFIGFYIAFSPNLYFEGFLKAFSPKTRDKVHDILVSTGHALRWWLLGKSISMLIIGILTFVGLLILNVSLAFILGLLAGILAFIPYIGPILSAIPAVLIAFTQSPLKALYVIILYCVIHVIEGYFITPFIEQRTVYLPPAFTILMQILLILLVGFLGLALASPLTVVLLALFQSLYIKRFKPLKEKFEIKPLP